DRDPEQLPSAQLAGHQQNRHDIEKTDGKIDDAPIERGDEYDGSARKDTHRQAMIVRVGQEAFERTHRRSYWRGYVHFISQFCCRTRTQPKFSYIRKIVGRRFSWWITIYLRRLGQLGGNQESGRGCDRWVSFAAFRVVPHIIRHREDTGTPRASQRAYCPPGRESRRARVVLFRCP